MFSPPPPGFVPVFIQNAPPSPIGVWVEFPGSPPCHLTVPITPPPFMPPIEAFNYLSLQTGLQQAQVDTNLYLSGYVDNQMSPVFTFPSPTQTQLPSPSVCRKQPLKKKGNSVATNASPLVPKRSRSGIMGESPPRPFCIHGFDNYTRLECLYSCSHWSNRPIHPNQIIAHYVKRVSESSEKNKQLIPCQLDVPYGDSEAQKIDIFGAESLPGESPIFAFIHGGFWKEGTRRWSSSMAGTLTSFGSVYVAIGYDLAPKVGLDDMVNQIVAAFKYLHQMAVKRGSRGVYLCGHSAGAHLLMMALSRMEPDTIGYFRGAFLLSGIFDITPLVNTYIGNGVGLTAESTEQLSPINCVEKLVTNCRQMFFAFVVAECESQTFVDGAREMYQLMNGTNKLAKRPEFHVVQNEDHFSILTEMDDVHYSLAKLIKLWMGL